MAEHDDIIASLLLLSLVFASLLIIGSVGRITGLVVADTEQNVEVKVEELVNKLDFLNLVDDISICLLIKMDATTTYSYDIDKIGSVIDVNPSENLYCDGLENEDFVFSYVSYSEFLEHAGGTPTLSDFKETGDGTNFYVLPSKYIEVGMSVKNRAEFESNFGEIFDEFTATEKSEFLTPEAREPRGFPTGLIFTIISLLIVVILVILLVPKFMKKPTVKEELEVSAYIKSALAKGNTEEDIRQSLIDSGWSEEEVNQAMNAVKPAEEPETESSA